MSLEELTQLPAEAVVADAQPPRSSTWLRCGVESPATKGGSTKRRDHHVSWGGGVRERDRNTGWPARTAPIRCARFQIEIRHTTEDGAQEGTECKRYLHVKPQSLINEPQGVRGQTPARGSPDRMPLHV
jgi:hypothetical protein